MIYKRCGRCGRRIPSGTACACYQRQQDKRIYKKAEGIKKEYHTQRWKELRAVALSRFDGLDVYLLYKYRRAAPADTAHHIEPASIRPELFYDLSNLLPVSRAGHVEIHERYKKEGLKAVQEELWRYQRAYLADGVGKKVF